MLFFSSLHFDIAHKNEQKDTFCCISNSDIFNQLHYLHLCLGVTLFSSLNSHTLSSSFPKKTEKSHTCLRYSASLFTALLNRHPMFASKQPSSLKSDNLIWKPDSLFLFIPKCCLLLLFFLQFAFVTLVGKGVLENIPRVIKLFQNRTFCFWLAIVFAVCHGSLLPYRRTDYLSQTIQCSLETIGFYRHSHILSISIF